MGSKFAGIRSDYLLICQTVFTKFPFAMNFSMFADLAFNVPLLQKFHEKCIIVCFEILKSFVIPEKKEICLTQWEPRLGHL